MENHAGQIPCPCTKVVFSIYTYYLFTIMQRVHAFCIDNRDTVRKMLKELDPEAVEQRRRRLKRRIYRCKVYYYDKLHNSRKLHFIPTQGPNQVWHIDGYDKLSHYGLTIHGCIDGYVPSTVKNIMMIIFAPHICSFSRKIL